MSRENVDVVRRFYDAYERNDRDGLRRLLSAEVEFIPLGAKLMGGSARGVDRVLQNITEFGASFASYDVRPERFHEAGDHVVTVLHRSARSARSPAPIEDRFAQLFSLRDGRVVRIQSFRRVEDALEAAGST